MIYILKSTIPAGTEKHKAEYYLGTAEDGRIHERIEEHRQGRGAALTRWWVKQGAEIEIVALFTGARHVERYLKNRKSHATILKQARNGKTHWQGELFWNGEHHHVQTTLLYVK